MSKVGNDPQHGSGIKLGRVGGQYQADLEVLHFILQLIDPFFLLGFCEQVTQTAYAFHIIDIGKSGIFDRIEKYDLSFDELDKRNNTSIFSCSVFSSVCWLKKSSMICLGSFPCSKPFSQWLASKGSITAEIGRAHV